MRPVVQRVVGGNRGGRDGPRRRMVGQAFLPVRTCPAAAYDQSRHSDPARPPSSGWRALLPATDIPPHLPFPHGVPRLKRWTWCDKHLLLNPKRANWSRSRDTRERGMETPNLWTRSQLLRPGGMRVCPAGLPVKAHAPAASQVSNIRLWPSPRVDIGRDEMDQGRSDQRLRAHGTNIARGANRAAV